MVADKKARKSEQSGSSALLSRPLMV